MDHTPASYKATGFGALRYANHRFALAEQSATSSLTSELVDEDVLDYHGLRPCGLTAKKRDNRKGYLSFCWWTIKDSNLGPTGYEPVALTN